MLSKKWNHTRCHIKDFLCLAVQSLEASGAKLLKTNNDVKNQNASVSEMQLFFVIRASCNQE